MHKTFHYAYVILVFCLGATVAQLSLANTYAHVWGQNKGAVASVNPIATHAGIQAFEAGGNAIDAALATAFTLGVVDSSNSGIGGGLFILVHTADGEMLAIDGREMAPAAAHRDMYIRNGKVVKDLSKTGALASGIPGSVAALYELQKKAGNLTFKDVILPAAKVAEKGFAVDTVLGKRLQWKADDIQKFPASAKIFLKADGSPYSTGEIIIQKDLAKTYRKLAKHGPDYFYKGEFAKQTVKWMQANGGIITEKDFANYEIKYRDPVESTFNGHTIVGFPPPSSGGIHVAQILNILEQFELKKLNETERYHLIIEAMKLAFADRAYWLGDSDFVDVPKGLIDEDYAKQLAKKMRLTKVSKVDSYSTPPNSDTDLFDKHTTHIAAADADGNWVAITTTLNTSFGSKVVIPGTGVLMNNQMDDFSAEPGVANAFGLVGAEANSIEGKKRPLSSMSPTIVLKEGKPVMTVGAAGGPTIISQVMQAIFHHIYMDLPLKQAVETARVHHQWKPDRVYIDKFASKELREGLTEKGHDVKDWPPFGATQAISIDDGKFEVVTEPRLIAGDR